MDVLILKCVLFIIVQFVPLSNAIEYDEGCFLDEPAALQVAFVMDQTGTFLIGTQNRPSFFKEFAALAPKLMTEIDKDYPGSQFALSTHYDWPFTARPPYATNSYLHNDTEGCYRRVTQFTTNQKYFQDQMQNGTITAKGSGEQENALSALAFTAADAKLGWVRNSTFTNGKLVRRVLILVTDEDDLLTLGRPGSRKDFRGDGTDTCATSKPPTHEILKEVFEKYQMTVIALLAENKKRRNLTKLYEQHFEKIGSSIKYCYRSFVILTGKSLWTDSELKGKDSPGFWSGETSLEDGGEAEGVKNFKPLMEAEIAKLSETRAKDGKYDDIIKLVKDCLKETDSSSCVFGDPPGFNTLGF